MIFFLFLITFFYIDKIIFLKIKGLVIVSMIRWSKAFLIIIAINKNKTT
jgi:hypothetical protein